MEEVLFEIPHVKVVRLPSGAYCVMVEDTVLNDYVEDLLWDDYEYEATSVSMQGDSMLAVYSNYFDAGFPIAGVIDLLQQLDVNEVERIFRLNN